MLYKGALNFKYGSWRERWLCNFLWAHSCNFILCPLYSCPPVNTGHRCLARCPDLLLQPSLIRALALGPGIRPIPGLHHFSPALELSCKDIS